MDPTGPQGSPPRIINLNIVPAVVCVGGEATINFTVQDDGLSSVEWQARLNTTVHGTLSPESGGTPPGQNVTVQFKAATSGNHQGRPNLTVLATDESGAESEPSVIEFMVFNCN
jgi:hypothetical protein